jgi:hypothetical protein
MKVPHLSGHSPQFSLPPTKAHTSSLYKVVDLPRFHAPPGTSPGRSDFAGQCGWRPQVGCALVLRSDGGR